MRNKAFFSLHLHVSISKGIVNGCHFFIWRRSVWKTSSWKFYCDRISTFHDTWRKPNVIPERFLNEADLVRNEIWRHEINAAVRKKQENRRELFIFVQRSVNPTVAHPLHCLKLRWNCSDLKIEFLYTNRLIN